MISLRVRTSSFTAIAVAALALVGCGRDLDPTAPSALSPNAASFDGRPGNVGNSAKNGSIATRVLLDAQGNATLEVRTGTYDNATNSPAFPAATDGWFDKLQYKVLDASGKQVLVRNVDFKTDGVNVYRSAIDLCSNHKGDAGDNDGDKDDQPCTGAWGAGWTVLVQANLKGVDGDRKKTDVVRDQQPGVYLPDVDIKTEQVWLGVGGNRSATLTVVPGAVTTYSVDFPNTKSINGQAPALGANMACAVFVDGVPQFPGITNGFSYSSPAIISIAPGQTVPCVFSLKLPAGTHTIRVTAVPLYPGDYDATNNTTADFTITAAAATGNPDVAAGLTQADTGNGAPHNLTTFTGSNSIRALEPITLWQYATLAAGQAPSGAATCTLTILNTGTNASSTVSGTVSVTPGTPSGACKIPYTFAAAGTYTITPVISLPNGDTDANPANNTGAAVTITIAAPLPEATVTVNDVQFTDAAEHISNKSFVPGTSADSVHSGDIATYAATIGVSSLVNTTAVSSLSCHVFIDGVDKTSTATWASGPTLTNVAAGTATCSITQAFIETDNNLHPHTIEFSVQSAIKNNASAADTSKTGTINDIRRVDVQASGFQIIDSTGVAQPMSSTPVLQGSTITILAPLTNLNPSVPTVVTCGPLLSEVDAVTGFTAPATDTAATAFSPVINTPTVSLAAGGTGSCSYTVTGPKNLGVGAIPLVAIMTPASGSPADPAPANNAAADVLTLKSDGSFTDVSAATVSLSEEYFTTGTSLVPDSILTQTAEVNQLALLVIPNNADLGSFTLAGTVTSNGKNYGTGTYQTEVYEGTTDQLCQRSATTGLVPAGAINTAHQRWHAAICAAPSTTQPGFQVITIDYTQDLEPLIYDSTYPMFSDPVQVKVVLSYTLKKGNTSDQASALITINVPATKKLPVGTAADGTSLVYQRYYDVHNLPLSISNVVSPAP
ncbi:MAG TPA: hypothetical protein VHB25_12870 [Gemmatimonadaceae bacterium]|nr:hypothetical protein [Gemmatimonadaceae bacterium]